MRDSFSEHVATYFNSVVETFNWYYPSSTAQFFFNIPKISTAAAAASNYNQENLRTVYFLVFLTLFILYIFKRVLHLDHMGSPPVIHMHSNTSSPIRVKQTELLNVECEGGDGGQDSDNVMAQIISKCSYLKSIYKPTWFWGKSGHIQTLLFGVMQKPHKIVDVSEAKQYFVTLEDGSLVSFHVYEALKPHQSGEEVTLIMCPGIFGNYNKSYVQSTVGSAVDRGYRIVCLNHLGTLSDVPLKTPRLFTYGNTEEYAAVCEKVFEMYPDSKFIAIGYSMGGNQVCKYLGETGQPNSSTLNNRESKFITAISICQGYDCIKASIGLTRWNKLQVVYSYILTQRWISLISRHSMIMDKAAEMGINWNKVRSCRGLSQFDRLFTSKFYGYDDFEQFMIDNSCSQHLEKINIPLLLINAKDDPLIGPFYHDIPIAVANRKKNVAFVETQHGGHLGYFENGMFFPREVWIDAVILEYCDAAIEQFLNRDAAATEGKQEMGNKAQTITPSDTVSAANVVEEGKVDSFGDITINTDAAAAAVDTIERNITE